MKGVAKKQRLTSWQRRKQKQGGAETGAAPKEASLNEACALAKAAAADARTRHRLKEPAQPGDAELIAEYQSAKAAMRGLHEAMPRRPKNKATTDVAARQKDGSKSADHHPKAPAPALPVPVDGMMTAAALGVSAEERRATKKAFRREEKKRKQKAEKQAQKAQKHEDEAQKDKAQEKRVGGSDGRGKGAGRGGAVGGRGRGRAGPR
jgi:hypothetical protein